MKRIASIDALRGITILAMIVCGAINWGSGLPAWMFHCQTPPPDFSFHPEVRGLTWVDMVFPFFIFSMGAALPVAIRKRLEKGKSSLGILLTAVRRWVVLVIFSLLIGASYAVQAVDTGFADWVVPVFRGGLWLSIFLALVRTDRKYVNALGWGLIAALMIVEWLVFGVELQWANNDCIIMLLAHASLMGTAVCLLTRKSFSLKFLLWAMVVAAKVIGFSFTQYMVIVIPASIVGELLLDAQERCQDGWKSWLAAAAAFVAVFVQLWGLFTRNIVADITVTIVMFAVFVSFVKSERTAFTRIGLLGFCSLILGIILDPACGGIAKDPCNLSFLFATGGQAALMLCVMLRIENSVALPRILTMTGQNPMIAYTISGFILSPILAAVGILPLMNETFAASPWLGFLQGAIISALVAVSTSLFTYFKLYLRS